MINKHKILIFHPYLAPYRIDLYNKLSKLYNLEALLTGSVREINTLGFDLQAVNDSARFSYNYISRGFYIGRHLISLCYLFKIISYKPTVLVAHELGVNSIIAFIFKPFFNYKLIVTIDDSPSMIKQSSFLKNVIRYLLIFRVDYFLVVHQDVKKYLADKYSNNNKFIFFPILQDEFVLFSKLNRASSTASCLSLQYNLNNKKIILFVGRLEPTKSPELLFDAFLKLHDSNCLLIFIGTGSLKGLLELKVNNLDLNSRIFILGQLTGDKLFAWYKLADIFVLPSKYEPFGAVINEALVAGCLAIASDKVGSNCLIQDSYNGYIFQSNNVDDLVNKLNLALFEIVSPKYIDNRFTKMSISFNELINQFCVLLNDD